MVMEKSWNFWDFENFWNFWKSHEILTKIAKGHGKVMEFWNWRKEVMEKSWNLTSKFLILMNWRCYVAAFQTPTNMYVDIEVMEFRDMVMEKSWNFVAKISWQPWISHFVLMGTLGWSFEACHLLEVNSGLIFKYYQRPNPKVNPQHFKYSIQSCHDYSCIKD